MTHEDADALLDTLDTLEGLLNGDPRGIPEVRKPFVSALLKEMGDFADAAGRLPPLVHQVRQAVRGCLAHSSQFHLLNDILATVGLAGDGSKARHALWSRADEAMAELRAELQQYRRSG